MILVFLFFLDQVYRKVWAGDGGDGDVMRIVYRMRGLLGDATEEFIENLDPKKEEEVNNEQVYRMANVMAECGGIDVSVIFFFAFSRVQTGSEFFVSLSISPN
jgi:hypothetical protein